MEYQIEKLAKVFHHMCMEHHAILRSMQDLQAGMDAILQYCDIHPQLPQGSISNPIWIAYEEMNS